MTSCTGLNLALSDVRFITLSYLWSEDLGLFYRKRVVSYQQIRLGVLLNNPIHLSGYGPYYVLFKVGTSPIYLYCVNYRGFGPIL